MQQENYYIKKSDRESGYADSFMDIVISGSIFHGTGGYDLCK